MIPVRIRTNMDVREDWPTEMPAIPNVGDYILSKTIHRVNKEPRQVRLKVCSITWEPCIISKGVVPTIELGLPSNFTCMSHFDAWYEYITGRISHDYYVKLADRAMTASRHGRPRLYNPGLIDKMAEAIGQLAKPISELPIEEYGLPKYRLDKAMADYYSEQKYFPILIEYEDGTKDVIKDLDSLPVACQFMILELGVADDAAG